MKLEVISREPRDLKFDAPLLFVHGSCHAAWCYAENFLPYFAERGFSAHAVSLRGHGASNGRENLNRVSVANYVADVSQVAAAFSQKPVVIGHSLGGLVVQKFLEKHAARAGILLAPSPVGGMLRPGFRLYLKSPILFTEVFLTRDIYKLYGTPERVKANLFSADADDEKVEEYANRLGKESFRAAVEMIFNLPKPNSIKTPMLVLGGETDVIVPAREIEETARAYNAEYKIFPATAHDLMLERNWKTVADFMIDWLQRQSKV